MQSTSSTLITILAAASALMAHTGAMADGHCKFTQQGPYGIREVCEMPVATAEDCTALGDRESVSDPDYGQGACPVEQVVGTCDKGSSQVVYYSGDPVKLKTGCGFQGGTWLNGYAQP